MKWEILAGLLSGVATAPLVSIVDQAIFCNASGKATVMESLKTSFSTLLRSPGQFFRGPTFLWIWAVYGATYAVSNTTERALIDRGQANASSSVTKFAASSGTNVGMSLLKDRAFTRMFGQIAPRPLPPLSMLCYGMRDAITIAASFSLVEPLGHAFSERAGIDRHASILLAQLACPLLAQTLNTPLFLYGLNLYNAPSSTAIQHTAFIRREYLKTLACRVARIAPAYSIGGVLNRTLRHKLGLLRDSNKYLIS